MSPSSTSSSPSGYFPSLPLEGELNKPNGNNDLQEIVEAFLLVTKQKRNNLKVVIKDKRAQDQLTNKGFGQREDSDFLLQPYEALYLVYTNRLILKNLAYEEISFSQLLHIVLKQDKHILTKFLVYRDLRSRGYVAKEGFGFGLDFRVYERGEFEKKPAKYVVFSISEGTDITAGSFASVIEEIRRMGKFPVAAVIERRGEIIYYKTSKVHFGDNKDSSATANNVVEGLHFGDNTQDGQIF
ncbi:MAG TPA: tRNA-intron lyase [Nitrososphaeraceae archaeon]|jgi:tRNA-intron endonuclease|nr:tRNA-intron lyase [Nitrososphaeraceae archaeon]